MKNARILALPACIIFCFVAFTVNLKASSPQERTRQNSQKAHYKCLKMPGVVILDEAGLPMEDSSPSCSRTFLDTPGDRALNENHLSQRFSLFENQNTDVFRTSHPVSFSLDGVGEGSFVGRAKSIFGHKYLRPEIGGMSNSFSIGGGLAFSSEDALSQNLQIFGGAHYTTKKYRDVSFGFMMDPTGSRYERFKLALVGRFLGQPREVFWGYGSELPEPTRSTYDLHETGLQFSAHFQRFNGMRYGFGMDYQRYSVYAGESPKYPTTQELMGTDSLPGLSTKAQILSPFASMEWEDRDNADNPRAGKYLYMRFSANRSVDGSGFSFFNTLVDARGYVPLGSPRRVLALRGYGNLNLSGGEGEIPFYRRATLGGGTLLR
ncbi:BamA/TamA family outer membrane protein, partial [Acidobacteriota bacterium]